jgi:hypothetical protein
MKEKATLAVDPQIPQINAGTYEDIEEEVKTRQAVGFRCASIGAITDERTRELHAKALPPKQLTAIELELQKLDAQRAALEEKRSLQIDAAAMDRALLKERDEKIARLKFADQQIEGIATPESQREFILDHIGNSLYQFTLPQHILNMFAAIPQLEAVRREWPAMRAKLVADVEAARSAIEQHRTKFNIPNEASKPTPFTVEDLGPKRYAWPSRSNLGN